MKKLILILLAIVLVLSITGCAGTKGEIVIGCPQPLTGSNAMVGDAALKGAKLAVEELNKAGGILGRQIRLVSYDDQASPEEAVKIATKMIENDKVNFIIGSIISSCVLAAGGYYEEADIPAFGTGTSATWMQQGWKYVFRACPNAGMAMPLLVQKMHDIGIASAAVFQGQDDSSVSNAQAFVKACEGLGIKITTVETYAEGDNDFSGQIAKIIASKADAVFYSTYSVTQPTFIKQLRQFGYNGLAFGKETLSLDNISVAGKATDHCVFMYPYIVYKSIEACDDPVIKKFDEKFYAKFNEMPYHESAYRTYDSIMVLAMASKKAGKIDGASVRDAIETIDNYEGLGGTMDFTLGDREGIHIFKSYIIIDGKYADFDKWVAEGNYEALKK